MVWAEFDVGTIRLQSSIFSVLFIKERSNLVKPHFLDTKIFWRPGYLNLALRRDSMTAALFLSLDRTLILMWKASLPQFFTRYLLAQIRPASRASDESCSYSSETKWTQRGKSSTLAFLRPKSKIRILGSGTPRLNRDFG